MTNLPALKAPSASGTVARLMVRQSLPAQVSGYVSRYHVGLEVDDATPPVMAGDRGLERVGDQRDLERPGRLVHAGDGEAHAVDRDGSLQRHEPGDGCGRADRT